MKIKIAVVIPCFNEKNLLLTLTSLKNCDLPQNLVKIVVVINHSEIADKTIKIQNQKTYEEAKTWADNNSTDSLHFIIKKAFDLPKKHAGVGLARKIGMDEVAEDFLKENNTDGIIVALDADSLVQKNYFTAIETHFAQNPKVSGASIHYEHPVSKEIHLDILKNTFTQKQLKAPIISNQITSLNLNNSIYEAIIQYELFLRYFINIQRFTEFPWAFHTIGSSMAVRAVFYKKQGGMNRRKAGEDFYFIHKFTQLGNFSNLSNTTVIPSPRTSDRVPFGTGKAVGDFLKNDKKTITCYHPTTFITLKAFFNKTPDFFELKKAETEPFLQQFPLNIQAFLKEQNFAKKLTELQSNSTNFDSFKNRFFRWFNAFMMMKYAHFCRDNFYKNTPLLDGVKWLKNEISNKKTLNKSENLIDYLLFFREIDRQFFSTTPK